MRKKIFKNMCLLALVTILLSSLLVTIVYYANSDARMKSEVREETRFVRGAVELLRPGLPCHRGEHGQPHHPD